MTLRLILHPLLGHWRRHPLELATLLIGLALATALWSGVQALNAQARASYAQAAGVLGGATSASIAARDGQRFPLADYIALRRAGWPVSPVLEGLWRGSGETLRLLGIDPVTLPPSASGIGMGGDGGDSNTTGTDRLRAFILPPHLARAAPQTIDRLRGIPGLPPLDPAPDLPPDTLVLDIGAAETLLDTPGRVSRLMLPADQASRPLPADLAARLTITPPGTTSDLDRLTDSFHLNLTAFGFLSFVVGLFIVYSAIGLAFEQRKPLLRTLRACGVSARRLTAVLLLELIGLALIAGMLGTALGYLIAAALLPNVAASLDGLYGAQIPGTLSLDPSWWLFGLAISLIGALAAASTSLWRAWTLPLLAAAQPEAWRAAQARGARLRLTTATLITLATLGALTLGTGLLAGFAAMGGLLIAAALLLPSMLAALLALGRRFARGPVAEWIWADARQQLSGLSLALMALLLALSVNVGVGTMVDSFRLTFLGWLDQRLASEVYVSAQDADQARAITLWLDARPEVTAILPIWNARARLDDAPLSVYGFRDHATYRDTWPLLAQTPDAWDRVAAGQAALISEQLARRADLTLGDRLDIATPTGPWTTQVAAIYSDYGNPESQIMIATDTLARHFPDATRARLAIRVPPDQTAHLIGDLDAAFDLGPGITDQRALKDASRRIFEKTFAVTLALNALTLAVAGIALLTSLLTLANPRLAQLAPLWAMGLTRGHLALIELGKTLALAALTALIALPLGLAVAWVLTAVINTRAFGWRLPITLFPGDWLMLFGLALGTALLAALWPMLRLRRAAPVDLLRSFGNDR